MTFMFLVFSCCSVWEVEEGEIAPDEECDREQPEACLSGHEAGAHDAEIGNLRDSEQEHGPGTDAMPVPAPSLSCFLDRSFSPSLEINTPLLSCPPPSKVGHGPSVVAEFHLFSQHDVTSCVTLISYFLSWVNDRWDACFCF